MEKLKIYGAGQEVGRSCFLLQTDKKIVLDCGLKIHNKKDPHLYPLYQNEKVDLAVISHAHLDHIGYLPALFENNNIPTIATAPTKDIGELLLLDSAKIILSEYRSLPYKRQSHIKAMKSFLITNYFQKRRIGQNTITLFDAGHISGSATVLVEYKSKRILYSGDFKLSHTYLHSPAHIEKDIDILIIESTYANREHPIREDLEIQLVQKAREVVENGGHLLLPAFAVGRTQELLAIFKNRAKDIPLWIDGMGIEATKIILKYPQFIKDPKTFRKYVEQCNFVLDSKDRKKVLKQPGVIISTAGMLQGGPALKYLSTINEKSEVVFSGYCVEDTNGYKLQNFGYVEVDGEKYYPKIPVSYFDFSAHASRSELFEFVKQTNPSKIICIHGDEKVAIDFAEELKVMGYDAIAPKTGEEVILTI
ncbi:MAG: MBL fold metallo-hydrolase [Candidatus Anstonellaceae archaeon]